MKGEKKYILEEEERRINGDSRMYIGKTCVRERCTIKLDLLVRELNCISSVIDEKTGE